MSARAEHQTEFLLEERGKTELQASFEMSTYFSIRVSLWEQQAGQPSNQEEDLPHDTAAYWNCIN